MATLSLKHIDKIYPNNVQAVFDFNLEIKDKEFIVLVGPSGCGKSTTLRMIAGLEDISSGELFVDGELVNDVHPKDRNMAMVFQSYALYPQYTVYDNIAFALKLRKNLKPVYLPNKDVDLLMDESRKLRVQAHQVEKLFKKQQQSKELLEKRNKIYDQIFEINEKICSIQEPKVGKDLAAIKRINKEIRALEKQVVELERSLDLYYPDNENERFEKLKTLEELKEKLSSRNETLNSMNDNDENYKNVSHEIKKLSKEIESVKNELSTTYRDNSPFRKSAFEIIKFKKDKIAALKEKSEYLSNNETPLQELRKLTKTEIDDEVNKVARAIDLTRYLFRKPAALSGGQRQRVALGRAIIRNPKVFLMDEPLSNLDAKLRVQTRGEIIKIHEKVGATTIYVTHDQTEAMTMASRIVVMKDGYIQQIGTPEEVYNDPNNKFVGSFIGSPSMNFVQCKFVKDHLEINNNDNILKIDLNKKDISLLEKNNNVDVILGIRPESISFSFENNDGFEIETDFSELLGHELLTYFYINDTKIVMKTDAENAVKSHSKVYISFDKNKLYFFDTTNEMRIR